MNDPITDTRKANAAAMVAARFVTPTTNDGEIKTVDAANAPVCGILMESSRFIGDEVRIAIGGGPVPLEAGAAFARDVLLASDSQGRAVEALLPPGTLSLLGTAPNIGARAMQAASGAGVIIQAVPQIIPIAQMVIDHG